MKAEDFLEKNEVREMTILSQLISHHGSISYNDMLDHLSVSKASLENDLESIKSWTATSNQCIAIHYDGQTINLKLGDEMSLLQIYRRYLDQSVKTKIITFLFKYQKFTITQLAQKLAISESSLFRKIKELNNYLKEFNIKIRNGRFDGEELQIRYFYFQFYYYIEDKRKLLSQFTSNQLTQTIQSLENYLKVTISSENKQKLRIWLIISKMRITIKKLQTDYLRNQMQPYLKDPLYHKIQVMVFRYFSRYSIEVDEGEAMLHFAYLLAFSILSENDFHEYRLLRDRHAPIASLDTYIAETIIIHFNYRRLPYMLEREMYYHLTHMHTLLYFFRGDIEYYDETVFIQEKQPVGKTLNPFAEKLLETSTWKFDNQMERQKSLLTILLSKYLSLLVFITSKMTKVLQVGIDLKLDDLYKETLSELLISKIRPLNGVHSERYVSHKKYDLILTNETQHDSDQYNEARVYVLSKILSSYDMRNIQRILQELNT
ncbi:helix-turn-helix domain-containing protein [Alkalibacterium kapii]|uniref:Transcriptional regulator n=1 Tax=Alkalibacterium kapii TaxID=426704 RepID=A0A511ARF2_9LACT|nr:helix-turn-helix domain-containing protein [Alkalibacterium kapii]GEK90785.1 transcriptional regulator [Alkalibacterium kapii]